MTEIDKYHTPSPTEADYAPVTCHTSTTFIIISTYSVTLHMSTELSECAYSEFAIFRNGLGPCVKNKL